MGRSRRAPGALRPGAARTPRLILVRGRDDNGRGGNAPLDGSRRPLARPPHHEALHECPRREERPRRPPSSRASNLSFDTRLGRRLRHEVCGTKEHGRLIMRLFMNVRGPRSARDGASRRTRTAPYDRMRFAWAHAPAERARHLTAGSRRPYIRRSHRSGAHATLRCDRPGG